MRYRAPLILILALALSAPVASAQNPPPPPPPGAPGGPGGMGGPGGAAAFAQRRMQALLQGITLAPAQQARVDSIVTAYAAQMPAFTPGQMPSPEDRQRRRELSARQDSTLRAVLTPEQQTVWDQNAATMPQMRRPGN